MTNNPFDFISAKVNELLHLKDQQSLDNPASLLIQQGLQKMGFVSLDDFETQREVLNRLRIKAEALELRVAELEKRV